MFRIIILLILAFLMVFPAYSQVGAMNPDYTCLQWHTVVRGDTLSRLARNNGTNVAGLQEVNAMGNRTRIYVGERLCVRFAAAHNPEMTTYVVQRGDTLTRIARRFGVNMQVLAEVNNITNPNRIYVGQTLVIPDFTIQQ